MLTTTATAATEAALYKYRLHCHIDTLPSLYCEVFPHLQSYHLHRKVPHKYKKMHHIEVLHFLYFHHYRLSQQMYAISPTGLL